MWLVVSGLSNGMESELSCSGILLSEKFKSFDKIHGIQIEEYFLQKVNALSLFIFIKDSSIDSIWISTVSPENAIWF